MADIEIEQTKEADLSKLYYLFSFNVINVFIHVCGIYLILLF